MHPRGRPFVRGGFADPYEPERSWEDGFDPRVEQFYNASFNSYASGPGAYLPRTQQPFNRRQRDQSIPYTLFVTNFHSSTLEDGLRHVFSMHGNPLKIERKRDKYNDPIAFVDFATQREADNAISALNGKPPLGWCVTYARDRFNDEGLINEILEVVDSRLGLSRFGGEPHQAMRRPTIVQANQADIDYYERPDIAARDYPPCVRCGFKAPYTCRYCPTRYCGKECQHQDWPAHKRQCQPPPPLVVAEPAESNYSRPVDNHTGAIPRERVVELPARASRLGYTSSNSVARSHIEVQQLQNSLSRLDLGGSASLRAPAPFHNDTRSRVESSVSPTSRDRVVLTDSAAPLAPTGIKPLDDYVRRQSQPSPPQSHRSASRVNGTHPSTPVPIQVRGQAAARTPEERPISQQSSRVQNPHQVNNAVKSPTSSSSIRVVAQQPAPAPAKTVLKKFAKRFSGKSLVASIKSELVLVCFVKSPDEIYVQLKSTEPVMGRIMNKIEESVGESPPLLEPAEGHPCLAIFDGLWYRAVVLKVLGNDVGVRYIDYGNTARITNAIENVRMMEEELSVEPFGAIRVKLDGIAPVEGNEWDAEARTKLKEWAEYQHFNLQSVENNGQVLIATLKKAETDEDAAEFLISHNLAKPIAKAAPAAPLLLAAPRAQPFSEASAACASQPASATLHLKSPSASTAPDLQPSSSNSVRVSSPLSANGMPGVQSVFDSLKVGDVIDYLAAVPFDADRLISIGSLLADEEAIERILKFDLFAAAKVTQTANVKSFTPRSVVAAHSPFHHQWFRACVLSSKQDNSGHRVLYVDFGNEEDVSQVAHLPTGFNEPYLAVKLTLIGDIDSKIEADAAKNLGADSVQQLVVDNRNADGTFSATLREIQSHRVICRVSIDSWKSLVKTQPPPMRPTVGPSAVNTTPPAAVASPAQKSTPLPTPKPAQTPAQNLQSPAAVPAPRPVPFSASEPKSPQKPMPVQPSMRQIPPQNWQAGQKSRVVVVTATDLDSFWVQPMTEDTLENIDEIQAVVNDLAPKSKAFDSVPVAGSYVAAIFPDDGCFYRAKIKTVSSTSIGVLYVDYGNSANVTLDQIRPLPEELFKQATCCSRVVFTNVGRTTGSIPPQVIQFLAGCLNQTFDLLITSVLSDFSIECVVTNEQTVVNEEINKLLQGQDEKLPTPVPVDENPTPAINGIDPVSDVPDLIEAQPSTDVEPVDNTILTINYDDGVFIDLPESDAFEALVLSCASPASIQICPASTEDILKKLDKLKEEMTTYAEGYKIGFTPELGDVCMVRFQRELDEFPYWYRAACLQITEDKGSKQYFMILVDYGGFALVDVDDLRRIPKRFVDYCPFVAQQAILKDVHHMAEIDDSVCARTQQLLPMYCKVECRVVGRDGPAYVVEIPSLAEVLRGEGLI